MTFSHGLYTNITYGKFQESPGIIVDKHENNINVLVQLLIVTSTFVTVTACARVKPQDEETQCLSPEADHDHQHDTYVPAHRLFVTPREVGKVKVVMDHADTLPQVTNHVARGLLFTNHGNMAP